MYITKASSGISSFLKLSDPSKKTTFDLLLALFGDMPRSKAPTREASL
jgi:hypothetical protein